MSWDVFVQDLPAEAQSVDDIPDEFRPQPIGDRQHLVDGIKAVVPEVDFSNPTLGVIEGDGYAIEISIGPEDPVAGFAFHTSGGGSAAAVIGDIIDALGLRALDPQAPGGIFRRKTSEQSFAEWQDSRGFPKFARSSTLIVLVVVRNLLQHRPLLTAGEHVLQNDGGYCD